MRQLPEKRRVILIGPNSENDSSDPLGGRAGKRLVELCGLGSLEELDRKFERRNLLTEFYGKKGFPTKKARARARQLTPGLRNRDVIFLGRNVGRAFGLLEGPWFNLIFHRPGSFTCCVAPHPSGVSLWWNDLPNRLRATKFFTEVANGKLNWMRVVALQMAWKTMEEIFKSDVAEAKAKMEKGEV